MCKGIKQRREANCFFLSLRQLKIQAPANTIFPSRTSDVAKTPSGSEHYSVCNLLCKVTQKGKLPANKQFVRKETHTHKFYPYHLKNKLDTNTNTSLFTLFHFNNPNPSQVQFYYQILVQNLAPEVSDLGSRNMEMVGGGRNGGSWAVWTCFHFL